MTLNFFLNSHLCHLNISNLASITAYQCNLASITAYQCNGHELDALSISTNGIKLMVEIIWTPSAFREMTILRLVTVLTLKENPD